MTHVFTRTRPTDAVWLKGMSSMLRHCGGGRIVKARHGIEVHAANPARLAKTMDWRLAK